METQGHRLTLRKVKHFLKNYEAVAKNAEVGMEPHKHIADIIMSHCVGINNETDMILSHRVHHISQWSIMRPCHR